MKFSIIGTGFIMPRHVQSILEVGGEIQDTVNNDSNEEAWREMVNRTNADCIVILTPNDLHFDMALAAAERGKMVLCEKPLVIKSEQAKILAKKKNIFTVLQLRYHPLVKQIQEEIKNSPNNKIEIDISVHRDKDYYRSWKGQKERSGGLLFNLGIHYFDLLLHLFGPPKDIQVLDLDDKTGSGVIKGENYLCNCRVSSDEERENQRRIFKINGKSYNFSSSDNLSYENLHRFIYQDLLKRKGILPEEILKSIELVEKLYQSYQ